MIKKDESVEITWKNGETTLLPNLWLRDNCACDLCRNTQTTEKLFQLAQVDVNLMPETVDLIEDELHLLWPDGHRSVYDGSAIRALTIPQTTHLRLWSSEFRPQQFDYGKFIHNDSIAVDAIENFLSTGTILLTNAPTKECLENLAPMLGPLRETVFGRIHNVVVDSTGYNVASTNLELPPHTDLPSYSWPPSVQALHMLVNETEHGESIIVDGFAVATQFRNAHPNWFDRLCYTPVPFRIFDDNNETFATQPIIQLDTGGQIAGVRYSNQTMQPMNPVRTGINEFYSAYHEFSSRITSDKAKAIFRLEGGQILLVAGHRVLHARKEFVANAKRHLQDAYFEHDNIRNHLTVIQRRLRKIGNTSLQ